MPPIQLYVIIALLILNGITGGLYAWTKFELIETKAALETCQEANKACTTTVDINETETTLSEDSCESQIDNIRNSNEELKKRNNEVDSLLKKAQEQLKAQAALNKINKVPVSRPAERQPIQPMAPVVTEETEVKIEDAEYTIYYLNSPVPRDVEQLLMVRKNQD